MKKLLVLLTITLFCMVLKAQSFVCTDFNYYGTDLSDKEIQKEKIRCLGSKAVLTFYDNNVKLVWTDTKGSPTTLILMKVGNNEYYVGERKGNNVMSMSIKLQKWFEYIKSFTVTTQYNQSVVGNATFKRD